MARPTREEAEALLGKRTALPGGPKNRGTNFDLPKLTSTKEEPAADFRGVTNPRRVIDDRLKKAEVGMACGGKVKRYASGGSVRGCGIASKGHTKGKMR